MNRFELATLIADRLEQEKVRLQQDYQATEPSIGHFIVDDLLPADIAERIYRRFPEAATMKLKKSLREYKYIAAQMNEYDPLLEEAVFAFQDDRVVGLIKQVCGMSSVYPDVHLYAGGISMMGQGQYLNPHLDNSHDKDRDRWRVLNLLYYVTPDWAQTNGGNLELWPRGMDDKAPEPITIHSKFNRLAIMATHGASWHSVSPIVVDGFRCCVSNYYFSDEPLKESDRFHVTSFRGRPEQPMRDLALQADITFRSAIRKVFKKGVKENTHVYKREGV
jgi:Rps23 Pro-64 3,4-dihydroxylase Tpa1-like proline 4-hydroxylase